MTDAASQTGFPRAPRVRRVAAQVTPGSGIQFNPQDSEQTAKVIRRVYKKIRQEVDLEKHGFAGIISAIEKAFGIRNESFTAEEQSVLVEFIGTENTVKLMLSEDTPAISPGRARTVVNWLELFLREAFKKDPNQKTLFRLARKTAMEYVNALADRSIRS